MLNPAFWASSAAILGALGVALGAFGAHALRARLDDSALSVWQTAVQYHFFHALALFAVAWLVQQTGAALANTAGVLMLAGILLFSGSLYALTLTGVRMLGAITPIGGVLMIAAWVCLAVAATRLPA